MSTCLSLSFSSEISWKNIPKPATERHWIVAGRDIWILILTVDIGQAGKTLSPRAWYAAFNEHGQLKLYKVLKRIRRGVSMSTSSYIWFTITSSYYLTLCTALFPSSGSLLVDTSFDTVFCSCRYLSSRLWRLRFLCSFDNKSKCLCSWTWKPGRPSVNKGGSMGVSVGVFCSQQHCSGTWCHSNISKVHSLPPWAKKFPSTSHQPIYQLTWNSVWVSWRLCACQATTSFFLLFYFFIYSHWLELINQWE